MIGIQVVERNLLRKSKYVETFSLIIHGDEDKRKIPRLLKVAYDREQFKLMTEGLQSIEIKFCDYKRFMILNVGGIERLYVRTPDNKRYLCCFGSQLFRHMYCFSGDDKYVSIISESKDKEEWMIKVPIDRITKGIVKVTDGLGVMIKTGQSKDQYISLETGRVRDYKGEETGNEWKTEEEIRNYLKNDPRIGVGTYTLTYNHRFSS
jgi:hypothetical protein